MPTNEHWDAVVVGSGPNGLAAAAELALAGRSVLLCEARDELGGGTRTAELTLPGFLHDVCSAVHPLAVASPAFQALELERAGLEWVHPELPLAHPLDGGRAVALYRDLDATARELAEDGRAWRRLFGPASAAAPAFFEDLLRPLGLPRRPLAFARFGLRAVRSATGLARGAFDGEEARALFGGIAAHSMLALEQAASAAFGLVLGVAGHAVGWPFPRGGAREIHRALERRLRELGVEIRTGWAVRSLAELPSSEVVLFDVAPRALARIAGEELPAGYRAKLERFRYGPGAFKLDWALAGPIPWSAEACRRAGTVHVGGSLDEIAAGERAVAQGRHAEHPFVLVAQQSLFDPTRAPQGRQVAWGYCHVPNGSNEDQTERVEAQIERFAPGFRELVLARHVLDPEAFERYDPNYVGGDINGGAADLAQLFFRPVARCVPYATPNPRLFLCSSSTPPGGGVHGMCGHHAARAALRRTRRRH